MSGVWSNALNLDLVIPSNGELIPGSGTVYIGGPRLPVEINSIGFSGAVVFYSTPSGYAAGVKYWFIAKYTNLGIEEALTLGWVDTSGVVRRPLETGVYLPGGKQFTALRTDDVVVMLDQFGFHVNAFGTGTSEILALANNMVIRAGNGQDQWINNTVTQTIAGVANTVVQYAYRWTPDYLVDFRFAVVFPAAPATRNFVTGALPGINASAIADTTLAPYNFSPWGSGWANDGSSMACVINGTPAIEVRGPFTNPGGAFIFQGSATYTTRK